MKHLIRLISVTLALIMAVMMPVESLAASEGTKYVSEIVTVSASSENEAKTKLEKAGYKFVPGSNLNSTLKTGVYLGYKETTDKKEALTDIAAMNMTGKFSYSDYKQIMAEYKENIEELIEDIETFIEEYQQNYGNESQTAVMAYSALNLFIDDDTSLQMGDYFLEYDFTDSARTLLTDTLTQANSDIVMSMIRTLSYAGDSDDTTLIDRLTKTGPDGIEKKYSKNYPTLAAYNKAMAKEYGATADKIYKSWDKLYTYILEVENTTATVNDDGEIVLNDGALEPETEEAVNTDGMNDREKEISKEFSTLKENVNAIESTSDFSFYALLKNAEFGDGSLLDYFKRPASAIDKSELYVIVDCMSEGQKKQTDFLGIGEILLGAASNVEGTSDEAREIADNYVEITENFEEPVSIYSGVDRTVFVNGVAFTSNAVAHEALTGKKWNEKLASGTSYSGDYWQTVTITSWVCTGLFTAACATAAVLERAYIFAEKAAKEALDSARTVYTRSSLQIRKMLTQKLGIYEITQKEINSWMPNLVEQMNECKVQFEQAQSIARANRVTASVIKYTCGILLLVALAVDIYTIVEFCSADKPAEENIPHHIMTTTVTPYGEDYVYYETVKTLDGAPADVNNHEADTSIGWLVLYSTKDTNAGDAICSDNVNVIVGSTNFGENASYVHLFNETAAINTTDTVYTGVEDKAGGTYITFNHTDSAYTSSAISNGYIAIISVAALAVGAAIGSLVTVLVNKKKKESK